MRELIDDAELNESLAETTEEISAREGIYGEIKRALIARGIPADEIAFIHDFNTPVKKAQAFAAANAGRIRVMIASTEKAGTGVNMQERLYALHHLDTPWRPADIEQREGRILRQGNIFPEVHICTYITEGSFDGYMWQTLESKARFISQIMAGEVTARTAEDVDPLVMTAAQIKAIASGNPQILEKVGLEVELTKLERLYSVWLANRRRMQREAEDLPASINHAEQLVAYHQRALALRQEWEQQQRNAEAFSIRLRKTLEGDELIEISERKHAGAQLRQLAFAMMRTTRRQGRMRVEIGAYHGFGIYAQADGRATDEFEFLDGQAELSLRLEASSPAYAFKLAESDVGILQSMDAQLRSLEACLAQAEARWQRLRHRFDQINLELGKGWEHAGKYQELKTRLLSLNAALSAAGQELEASPELASLNPDALRPTPEAISVLQLVSFAGEEDKLLQPAREAMEQSAAILCANPLIPHAPAPAVGVLLVGNAISDGLTEEKGEQPENLCIKRRTTKRQRKSEMTPLTQLQFDWL